MALNSRGIRTLRARTDATALKTVGPNAVSCHRGPREQAIVAWSMRQTNLLEDEAVADECEASRCEKHIAAALGRKIKTFE